MFGAIQFSGLASGLDTQSIISAVLNVERVPINQLEAQKSGEQAKLSLFGTLEGHVQALRDKAEELSTRAGLESFTVSSSAEGFAAIEATGSPATGGHTLDVEQLAQVARIALHGSTAITDPDASLGAGQVSFEVGGTAYAVDVDAGSSSLDDIAAAINADADASAVVTASVVNVGAEDSPDYQLVLTGSESGSANAISNLGVTVAGLDSSQTLQTAQNARIVIDGLAVERSTNVFEDVVDGLKITAQAETSSTISFTSEVDTEGIKTKLRELVDAYNEIVDFVNEQNEFSEDDGPGGELFGDSALRSLRSSLSQALFDVDVADVVADTEGFSTLSLVGIDVESDGRLSLDESQVDEKLAQDLDAFIDFFVDTDGFDNGGAAVNTSAYFEDTTADSGVFATLYRKIDEIVEDRVLADGSSVKGLFGRREDTLNDAIERIDDRIETLEQRLLDTEERLVAQFTALEEVLAGLNAQGASLSAIFQPPS